MGAEPPLNAMGEGLEGAMEHGPSTAHETAGAKIDATKNSSRSRKGSKIIGAVKSAAKGTVKPIIASDAARAKRARARSSNRLGVVPPAKAELLTGPVDFKGRMSVTTKSTVPAVGSSMNAKKYVKEDNELHPKWSVAIGDIKKVKKIGGYGWKAKLVVGWSLGRQVNEGLDIIDRLGNVRRITALPLRDQLFNRLIAIEGQKWEAWRGINYTEFDVIKVLVLTMCLLAVVVVFSSNLRRLLGCVMSTGLDQVISFG